MPLKNVCKKRLAALLGKCGRVRQLFNRTGQDRCVHSCVGVFFWEATNTEAETNPLQYQCLSEWSSAASNAVQVPTHTVRVVRNPVVCGSVLAHLSDHHECKDAREEEDDGRTVADGKPVHLSDWEGGGGELQ